MTAEMDAAALPATMAVSRYLLTAGGDRQRLIRRRFADCRNVCANLQMAAQTARFRPFGLVATCYSAKAMPAPVRRIRKRKA